MASETKRELSYIDAVREATDQEMARDSSVILFGLDVDDPKAIQGTTRGLLGKFGPERVFGTPLSEDAMTGVAIGAALAGLRPIHVHIRMDFLMLAMNQLINIAAKSRYMYGGQVQVPIVVRSMIGKSWGQGAQHSQGLYSFFMHVPGLKVVAPTTPYDAKGCLVHAIRDNDPVMYVEHRILHFQRGPVPETAYTVTPGKARITASGTDLTLVGISYMRSDTARANLGVNGAGVTVGVLSDSFNCLGGAASDVTNGDLSPVTVIQEISNCTTGTDEGRAMLQIVHGPSSQMTAIIPRPIHTGPSMSRRSFL